MNYIFLAFLSILLIAPKPGRVKEELRTMETDDGVLFVFKGQGNEVFVAGDFNNWNSTSHRMKKEAGVWKLKVPLQAGRYQYKFIVDGVWKEDPLNPNKVDDGYGGFNSVIEVKRGVVAKEGGPKITKDGVEFSYMGDAKSVLLAGSFNNWQGERMQKIGNKWVLTKKLPPGRYEYKFIVDGNWKEDPLNPNKKDDGYGGFNSVVEIKADVKFAGGPKVTKEEVIFEIEVDANSVLLAGSFNNWQGERMQKVGNKWVLKKKLPKGRHQYKFIIDGTWKEDPFNPNKTDDGYGGFNSVVEVK